MAKWQTITLEGFGTLEWSARNESHATLEGHREQSRPLSGSRSSYADYFHLRLDQHLAFLVSSGFFTREQRDEIADEIANHQALLDLPLGCLVHKDLALWNILGTREHIAAFIDFDDSISGDEMDDLSLLACFHDAAFLARAVEGYLSIRPLPDEYRRRFWLHLLRNMIVKAVIRVGAGYFDRDDGFFLIGSGGSGADLKRITHARITLALHGLASNSDLSIL